MTSGRWRIDSDSIQGESFKVTSPPLPSSLSVSADNCSTNSVPFIVIVKLTQRELAIQAAPKNTSGLPKSVRPQPSTSIAARTFRGAAVVAARSSIPLQGRRPPIRWSPAHILRPDRNGGRFVIPLVVEPVDG